MWFVYVCSIQVVCMDVTHDDCIPCLVCVHGKHSDDSDSDADAEESDDEESEEDEESSDESDDDEEEEEGDSDDASESEDEDSTSAEIEAVNVKWVFGQQVRKAILPVSTKYKALVRRLRSEYDIGSDEKLALQYEDDESELITIRTTADLKLALKHHQQQQQKVGALRVCVYVPNRAM